MSTVFTLFLLAGILYWAKERKNPVTESVIHEAQWTLDSGIVVKWTSVKSVARISFSSMKYLYALYLSNNLREKFCFHPACNLQAAAEVLG